MMGMDAYEKGMRKLDAYIEQRRRELKHLRIDDLLSTDQVREVEVPGLGIIRYGRLTVEDALAVSRIEDETEQAVETVARMLRKADPQVTVDKVKMLPADVFTRLASALMKELTGNFR
ncbi:hypothetical protein J7L70_01415 [Candidatus Bathyarchaeota archaeon]|nr:hypothetical protein [Candidatus Bathyarchaeota archaeon]